MITGRFTETDFIGMAIPLYTHLFRIIPGACAFLQTDFHKTFAFMYRFNFPFIHRVYIYEAVRHGFTNFALIHTNRRLNHPLYGSLFAVVFDYIENNMMLR